MKKLDTEMACSYVAQCNYLTICNDDQNLKYTYCIKHNALRFY